MSDATILAFDTSGPYCAAAVLRAGQITTRVEDMSRGQGERLMGLLDEMLGGHSLTWTDLDAIAVGIGPGNFTGIRIAVSAARGLALGLGKPAIGVSRFDTTARLGGLPQTTVPAPRDQVYTFDPHTMQAPMLADTAPGGAFASAADHTPDAHVGMIAQIAADHLAAGTHIDRPAPLYVRAPDAAPSKDAAPVILP